MIIFFSISLLIFILALIGSVCVVKFRKKMNPAMFVISFLLLVFLAMASSVFSFCLGFFMR